MSVKAIPEGFHSVTPYLIVKDAALALDFYTAAFAAQEIFRMDMPDGRIGHAEFRIGNSNIMLADEFPEEDALSPESLGGAGVSLLVYLENVDAQFATAIAAGASELKPVSDQFYGDRSGTLKDPFGHSWTLATHIEDLSDEEIGRRMAEMEH